MAFQPVDFNYFLARKYALQQQEANATTTNAESQRLQATANAGVAATQARMNDVTTRLLPGEAAAKNASLLAGARLTNTQADVLPGESRARIGQMEADTGLTTIQRLGFQREALTDPLTGGALAVAPAGSYGGQRGGIWGGALGGVMGPRITPFRLSPPSPPPETDPFGVRVRRGSY